MVADNSFAKRFKKQRFRSTLTPIVSQGRKLNLSLAKVGSGW
jgi:hypothetical protein